MTADLAYQKILDAAEGWICELPAAQTFLHGQSLGALPFTGAPSPHPISGGCNLQALPNAATPAAQAFCDAVVDVSGQLAWKNDYTADQPGIDETYLQGTSYIDLTGPNGPFVDDQHRIMIGYWQAGLSYPLHWHLAEEMYCIAAGRTHFAVDADPLTLKQPGDCVFHTSLQPHRMQMDPDPLLALIIWRGDGLVDVADLE